MFGTIGRLPVTGYELTVPGVDTVTFAFTVETGKKDKKGVPIAGVEILEGSTFSSDWRVVGRANDKGIAEIAAPELLGAREPRGFDWIVRGLR